MLLNIVPNVIIIKNWQWRKAILSPLAKNGAVQPYAYFTQKSVSHSYWPLLPGKGTLGGSHIKLLKESIFHKESLHCWMLQGSAKFKCCKMVLSVSDSAQILHGTVIQFAVVNSMCLVSTVKFNVQPQRGAS